VLCCIFFPGCERLSIKSTNLTKVVLDTAGSEIEDSDVLLEVKGETIVFLEGVATRGKNDK